jgi:2-amino-4-hydroxy-6-hydroxymethyldihydropteridine diphosphokinase
MTDASSVRAVVALGSNMGDRAAMLEGAVAALRDARGVRVLGVSPWVETEPVGGPPQPPFLNGCLELSTTLPARELLQLLQAVEARFGRDRAREVRNGPRTLDLDLLFYGEEVHDEPGLIVPHPRVEERVFVLEPLAALLPDLRLPRSRKTVRERLGELRSAAGDGR